VVVWVDLEKVWDSKWAARLGVNVDDVYIMRPAYAEQMVDVADLAIRSGQADLLVIDSIAAVTPTVEIEKSVEDQQMAEAARLLSKACRKWTSGQTSVSLGDGRSCTIIAINQIRMKVGLVFGDPRTASGGTRRSTRKRRRMRRQQMRAIAAPPRGAWASLPRRRSGRRARGTPR